MNDQLTTDELRAYQAGLLTGAARHRVERLLLENPFYADALDGLAALREQSGASMARQTADLRVALERRVRQSATKKRLWPLWIATTTAAILFMLAMAIYFILVAPNRPRSRQHPDRPPARVKTQQLPPRLAITTGLKLTVSDYDMARLPAPTSYWFRLFQ